MLYLFLATGFEEIEALATIDILRRSGLNVRTVSVMKERRVVGAHGIPVEADSLYGDSSLEDAQALILPGGMPGAKNLLEHEALGETLLSQHNRGGLVAAICAAPMVLGHLGILKNRRATCYPGFESELKGADCQSDLTVVDGNVITGKGPGAVVDFAFAIAAKFVAEEVLDDLKEGMILK